MTSSQAARAPSLYEVPYLLNRLEREREGKSEMETERKQVVRSWTGFLLIANVTSNFSMAHRLEVLEKENKIL